MKTIETLRCHTPPTPAAIEAARLALGQSGGDSDDPVLIAFEWFDAQLVRENRNRQHQATKHIIEAWAGRYVSEDDVKVAAFLHPLIRGEYPSFNLSSRRVWPHERRLEHIVSAKTMAYEETQRELTYAMLEE